MNFSFTLFFFLAFLLFLILAGVILSFRLTRRYFLDNEKSPTQVGLKYEEISFVTEDGLRLKGWWVPAPGSDKVVIQLHGHSGSMDPDIQYLPVLHKHGYHVLTFDFRGHGRSEGKVVTLGYLERCDVLAAVQFVKQHGYHRIALLGFSMGGMLAILTAAICPDVLAVISDGAPVRLRTALREWCFEHHIPRWLGAAIARWVLIGVSIRLRVNIFTYEPVRWVGRIAPRPLLLIHGVLDPYIPDFEDLVHAAGQGCQLWHVPDVGHTQISQQYPEQYYERIAEFLNANL
jgi:pimeloyl-ACP methyl ester carboxylesterase